MCRVYCADLGDVGAGDEGLLAGTGEDDHRDGVVVAERVQGGPDVQLDLPVHRVADVWSVDGDQRDAVGDVGQQCLVRLGDSSDVMASSLPVRGRPVMACPMISVWTSSVPS